MTICVPLSNSASLTSAPAPSTASLMKAMTVPPISDTTI